MNIFSRLSVISFYFAPLEVVHPVSKMCLILSNPMVIDHCGTIINDWALHNFLLANSLIQQCHYVLIKIKKTLFCDRPNEEWWCGTEEAFYPNSSRSETRETLCTYVLVEMARFVSMAPPNTSLESCVKKFTYMDQCRLPRRGLVTHEKVRGLLLHLPPP